MASRTSRRARTTMNNNRPLQSLEELLIESFDLKALRERSGLPHPLSKFASDGAIKDGPCADAILTFMHDLTLREPESAQRKNAVWFLLKSDKAFFFACFEAGVDGRNCEATCCGVRTLQSSRRNLRSAVRCDAVPTLTPSGLFY